MAFDPDNDREVTIFDEELKLLRRIAETSDDLLEGESWPEFCEANGGMEALKKSHAEAVLDHRQWMAGFDRP
jgi:hypothetical protein